MNSVSVDINGQRFRFDAEDVKVDMPHESVVVSCAQAGCAGCHWIHRELTGHMQVHVDASGRNSGLHWEKD